eukprot:4636782-Prymnesium_polylepis.1
MRALSAEPEAVAGKSPTDSGAGESPTDSGRAACRGRATGISKGGGGGEQRGGRAAGRSAC